MAVTYLGSLTVGECVPAFVGVHAQLLADLQAKLAAQQALILSLQTTPFRFTIQGFLQVALDLVTATEAQIALGIELPTIQTQLDLALSFVAQLEIAIALLLELQVAFGTAGVHAYAVDGAVSSLGGQLATALASGFPGGQPTDYANAVVLATSIPAAWVALGKVIKTA